MSKKFCNIRSFIYSALMFPLILHAEESEGTCYLEFAKAACWNNYKVELKLLDALTLQEQQHFNLSMNSQSIKVPFTCRANEQITFQASFEPPIWDQQVNSWYKAKKVYNVPPDVASDGNIWTVDLCFASDFNGVSLPPQNPMGSCSC